MTDSKYIRIENIRPGQLRFSKLNVQSKVSKTIKKFDLQLTRKKQTLPFDSGKSILDIINPLPAIKTCFGFLLLDGHHDVLQSLEFQAETVPIRVIEDKTSLIEEDLYKYCEVHNHSYFFDFGGENKLSPPKNFSEMINDPNRYFSAISARKFPISSNRIEDSYGAKYPLWVKKLRGTPFIEFKIADKLYKHKLIYQDIWESSIPDQFTEQAREVLKTDPITDLMLVPNKIHYNELKKLFSFIE